MSPRSTLPLAGLAGAVPVGASHVRSPQPRAVRHGEAALARLRAIEAAATPFQHAAWISAFLRADDAIGDFRLIEIADEAGNSLALPVASRAWRGLTLGRKVGDSHASFFMPVMAGSPDLWSTADLAAALRAAGRLAGIDAFLFAECPHAWAGHPNPLIRLGNQPAPSRAAMLTIDHRGENVIDRLFDREQRKKQRYKRRKLGEFGALASGWAPCGGTSEAALATFFAWKAQQFAVLGIPDPFAPDYIRRFVAEACCGIEPAARLFVLNIGDRPAAVIGTTGTGRHVSGMFTAYNPDPDLSRFSPGDVAMSDLIQVLAAEGTKGFDLGVGEARYKNHFCPEPLDLVDIALAVTPAGALAAAAWRGLRRAKRAIKQNPGAYDFAMGLRRRLSR